MKRAFAVLVILILAGGSWWVITSARRSVAGADLTASGVIQAQQDVVISAEIGGHIVALGADEGDEVEAGSVLVRLDGDLLQAQIAQARAAVEAAEANLAHVSAGARGPEIEAARAAVDRARAHAGAAQAAVDVARAHLHAAQAAQQAAEATASRLEAGASERELDIARQQIALARAQLWAAQARRDATEAGVDMPLSFYIVVGEIELGPIVVPNPAAPEQFDVNAAEASVSQAESSVTIEQLQHDQMEAGARAEELAATRAQLAQAQARVQMAQVQLEQAQQAVNAAETQVRKSQAQLELTLAGAKAETISVAEAKVAQARADVATLEVQREKLSLRAPMDGLVTERMVYEGETVVVGARLFVLSTLDPVILTIYVPENRIGRVRVGQAADLSVDAYPGRTFHGEVVHIASQAEFTPRNIQTREEQTTTVFAVRIKIPNPERTLKPGMTADATIR